MQLPKFEIGDMLRLGVALISVVVALVTALPQDARDSISSTLTSSTNETAATTTE